MRASFLNAAQRTSRVEERPIDLQESIDARNARTEYVRSALPNQAHQQDQKHSLRESVMSSHRQVSTFLNRDLGHEDRAAKASCGKSRADRLGRINLVDDIATTVLTVGG